MVSKPPVLDTSVRRGFGILVEKIFDILVSFIASLSVNMWL